MIIVRKKSTRHDDEKSAKENEVSWITVVIVAEPDKPTRLSKNCPVPLSESRTHLQSFLSLKKLPLWQRGRGHCREVPIFYGCGGAGSQAKLDHSRVIRAPESEFFVCFI